MRHILVTGATGFIGRRLVEQLIAEGYRVRALVRDPTRAASLPEEVERAVGDTTDRGSLDAALSGIEGVFHLAAVYGFGIDANVMRAINVEGARNVLDACAAHGVTRVVYVGSDTSLGDTAGAVRDETKVHEGPTRSAYEATKREAHEMVTARMAAGAPVVNAIVSTVYGPEDTSTIGQLFEHHLAGRLRFALDRSAGYTFAHVDDIATGLRLAYERGRVGQSYLLSGTPATFGELFDKLSAHTGIAAPAVEVPRALFPVVEPLLLVLGRVLGKSFAETRELLAMGRGVTRFFSGDKARAELDFRPRSLDQGLHDTLPWYLARERDAAATSARSVKPLLIGLALFDAILGAGAALAPNTYLASMHPRFRELHPHGPTYLVNRTGALWLFFAAAEVFAAMRPSQPELLMLVGGLRLMDVAADLFYLLRSDDLGAFGRAALIVSPLFNACVGATMVSVGARALRAKGRSPLDRAAETRCASASSTQPSPAGGLSLG